MRRHGSGQLGASHALAVEVNTCLDTARDDRRRTRPTREELRGALSRTIGREPDDACLQKSLAPRALTAGLPRQGVGTHEIRHCPLASTRPECASQPGAVVVRA